MNTGKRNENPRKQQFRIININKHCNVAINVVCNVDYYVGKYVANYVAINSLLLQANAKICEICGKSIRIKQNIIINYHTFVD